MNKFNALLMLKKQLNNMTDEQIKEIEFKIYSEDSKDWLAINLNCFLHIQN